MEQFLRRQFAFEYGFKNRKAADRVQKMYYYIANCLIRSKTTSNLTDADRANIAILQELLTDNNSNIPIVKTCNTLRCNCCECIIESSTFMDSSKTVTFNVDSNYDCNSKDILCMIVCNKCAML
jgi:hypothetical protein